jgi:Flp pilus assembly protein protease CpaA
VPTSKRPQINDVQYLRISNRILKIVLHEEVVSLVVAEVVMSKTVADETMKIYKS